MLHFGINFGSLWPVRVCVHISWFGVLKNTRLHGSTLNRGRNVG